jgi:endonuclease-3
VSIFDRLDTLHPNADTEQHIRTTIEQLVATILSAQCTDARVNSVTPTLFAQYPDARALATPEPEQLEPIIQPTGFFRMKARALSGMSRALVAEYDGEVPASMEALVELPGVGRKTANVVLGHAMGIPGFPVDRHVLRVANRIGLVHTDDPVRAESALCALLPPDRWTRGSDALILHGRRICKPKPLCDRCSVRPDCAFFKALSPAPARRRRGQAKR